MWLAPTAALADYESGYTAFQKGDYAAALNDWKLAAESGDARAQFYLGAMYDFALVNYAVLLRATDRADEAEKLEARAAAIRSKRVD